MYFINYLKILTLDLICLFFPIILYLLFIVYTDTYKSKKNNIILSLTLILSLLIQIILNKKIDYSTLITLNIPLLICYVTKKEKTSIITTVMLLIFFSTNFVLNNYLLLLEYIILFTVYCFSKKSTKFFQNFSIFFYLENLLFLFFQKNYLSISNREIIYLISQTLLFIIITNLIGYFFDKNKKVLGIKEVLKKLDKETKIKASIFKLNHELKNPLAVCNGYLEMINDATKDKKEAYLKIIKEEINRSLTVINDFSTLGKIKTLDKEEMDLAMLFDDLKDIFIPLYKENNGTIAIPNSDELYISGDYNRLKQVFVNIIKNSLESKNKNTINVDIKVKKYKNNYKIIINDNGMGMTKKELDHIEEMFYTTKENGSGVGIPYIKEIVELHHGNISYKSKKNQGTKVTLTLPI